MTINDLIDLIESFHKPVARVIFYYPDESIRVITINRLDSETLPRIMEFTNNLYRSEGATGARMEMLK